MMEFGGTPEPWTGYDESQSKMANTTLLQFSKSIFPVCQICID